MSNITKILPGLLLCIAIAGLSQILYLTFPTVGAATYSILIGLIIGNTINIKANYTCGIKLAEGTLLEISIFLLGSTVSFQMLSLLGLKGIWMVVLQMIFVLVFTIWVGKKLGFDLSFTYLMASGNAVCGSSAIGATAPAIHATQEEKGIAVTIVNLMGTILMFLLPLISAFLYHNETIPTSALIGSILQSVGQVVASGSLVNDDVKNYATIFKLVRVILLVVVVFVLSNSKTRKEKESNDHKVKIKFPWYVIGFLCLCIFYSIGIIPQWASSISNQTSHYLEIVALAAIGLRVNIKMLIKQGRSLTLYALFIVVFQVSIAILFISILL